ncbi:helix-turn-helix domain-containing protein [Cellulomonas sp. NPDC058312]|uniref:helix-turn-helix domain-containing protein n=1 Tax=Cellulomonas sp. NPDC058312 TaxID=3346441 RepID=UPI0036E9A6F5
MYAERPSRLIPGAVLWTVRDADPGGRVLPDGCMDLLLVDGRLLVAGPDTVAHGSAPVRPGARVSGLRLPPGAAPVLLGVPAHALRDDRPELAAVWGDAAARSWAATVDGGIDRLERLTADRLAARGGRSREVAAAAALLGAGAGAADVADRLGVTARTLHRRSLDAFGYGPRTLGRVLRLQRAVGLMGGGLPLAEVAHRAGYADQPHLARETRSLAGATPSELAAERASA